MLTLALAGCRRPLAPGETSCTTIYGNGVASSRCRTGQAIDAGQPEAEIAPTADEPRAIIEGDYPMVCTATKNAIGPRGACFNNALSCESFREIHPDSSPCREATAAACFVETMTITGERTTVCFPMIRACEEVLVAERGSPDVTDLSKRCGIYRMKQK